MMFLHATDRKALLIQDGVVLAKATYPAYMPRNKRKHKLIKDCNSDQQRNFVRDNLYVR